MPPQKPPKPQKRKPGGQPGNQNAFKHGYYSRIFKEREGEILSALSIEEIQEEIELTRINNRRILEAMNNDPNITYEQVLAGVRAISVGTALIGSLNRAAAGVPFESHEQDHPDSWLYNFFGIDRPVD
jgi:hypothetical protein